MTTHFAAPTPGWDLADVRRDLSASIDSRQCQLAALPVPAPDDLVAVLHRETVERILGELKVALRRLDEGTYGTCQNCSRPIARERLELRPWAVTCTACPAG